MVADETFTWALHWIALIEGGYVNHPDDPGGATKYGLAQAAHPDFNINALTWAEAAAIYEREYWYPSHCDRLPRDTAVAVFDGVVNHGRAATGGWNAVRFLQQAVGVRVDGIIGPVTLGAVRSSDERALVLRYLGYRAVYYRELVAADSALITFFRGWLNRLFRLQRYVLVGHA